MTDAPAEVLFYHLERAPLEAVLPALLEKTLERNWTAVVQSADPVRLEALDEALWTYKPDSFLPHGTAKDPHPERQPVYLTTGDEAPNSAGIRFLVHDAVPATYTGLVRIIFLFDGANQGSLATARAQWKAARAAGCPVTYWQQNAAGRWEKKA